jgi:hypothetical protein
MVLGEMQAIEARGVRLLDELQPLVEQLRDRPLAVLDVVEKSDFHGTPVCRSALNAALAIGQGPIALSHSQAHAKAHPGPAGARIGSPVRIGAFSLEIRRRDAETCKKAVPVHDRFCLAFPRPLRCVARRQRVASMPSSICIAGDTKEAKMSIRSMAATAALAGGLTMLAQPALAKDDADGQLGDVHFATSCNEVAQRQFDRAMRYQHSFWYRASREIFEAATKADPQCGIAHWGIALSLWDNPHNPPPAQNLPLALAAIQKAKAVGAKTARERHYIDALAVLYTGYDKTPYPARLQAYLKAMEALAQRYPKDDEAQIAYAITLNVSASPGDKTYAQQLKGAAILEPISKRLPQHPGVTHYLIHLYDYPALAAKGLDAANRYAKIAPAAPHAQHMPSHIYTRVGHWQESIASNMASVKAAKASKEYADQLHGQDYLVYAYLQLGRDSEARAVVDEMNGVTGYGPTALGAIYGRAASSARYMIERGDWNGAAALEMRPSRFPFVDAMTHYGRALGAARLGKVEAAKADIAKLAELRDKLKAANNAYWTNIVDIQAQIATAWLLHAEGKHADALRAMRAAADNEDKTEKHPITPGPLAPARELYGTMLLERGMVKEALAAFEASQAREANRFHGYAGAAMAAAKLGDKAKAKAQYQKLLALVDGATTGGPALAAAGRPEIAAARDYLANN